MNIDGEKLLADLDKMIESQKSGGKGAANHNDFEVAYRAMKIKAELECLKIMIESGSYTTKGGQE
mgnify:CR=1 FL=1